MLAGKNCLTIVRDGFNKIRFRYSHKGQPEDGGNVQVIGTIFWSDSDTTLLSEALPAAASKVTNSKKRNL